MFHASLEFQSAAASTVAGSSSAASSSTVYSWLEQVVILVQYLWIVLVQSEMVAFLHWASLVDGRECLLDALTFRRWAEGDSAFWMDISDAKWLCLLG